MYYWVHLNKKVRCSSSPKENQFRFLIWQCKYYSFPQNKVSPIEIKMSAGLSNKPGGLLQLDFSTATSQGGRLVEATSLCFLIALQAPDEFQPSDRHPTVGGQSAFRVMYATVLQGWGAQPTIFICPIKASVSLRHLPMLHPSKSVSQLPHC